MRICQHPAPSHARNHRLRTWKAIADTAALGLGIAPMLDRLLTVSRYLPLAITAPIVAQRIHMPTFWAGPCFHITVPLAAGAGSANLALNVS